MKNNTKSEPITDWNRTTPSDGDLFNAEFTQIYNLLNSTIGTIKQFMIPEIRIPLNYIVLDGRTVLKADYPLLEAKILGVEGFDTTSDPLRITVPDLRGYFLRFDNGRDIGDKQEDAIRNITGTFDIRSYNELDLIFNQTGAFSEIGEVGDPVGAIKGESTYPLFRNEFDASKVVPTADENRPKNVAIIYAIQGY